MVHDSFDQQIPNQPEQDAQLKFNCDLYFPVTKQRLPSLITITLNTDVPKLDIKIPYKKVQTKNEFCMFEVYNELWPGKFKSVTSLLEPSHDVAEGSNNQSQNGPSRLELFATLQITPEDIAYASQSHNDTVLCVKIKRGHLPDQTEDFDLCKLVFSFFEVANKIVANKNLEKWINSLSTFGLQQARIDEMIQLPSYLIWRNKNGLPAIANVSDRRFWHRQSGADVAAIRAAIQRDLLYDFKRTLILYAHMFCDVDENKMADQHKELLLEFKQTLPMYVQHVAEFAKHNPDALHLNWDDPSFVQMPPVNPPRQNPQPVARIECSGDTLVYISLRNGWYKCKSIHFIVKAMSQAPIEGQQQQNGKQTRGDPDEIRFTYRTSGGDREASIKYPNDMHYFKATPIPGHYSVTIYRYRMPFYVHFENKQLSAHVQLVRSLRAWLGSKRRNVKVDQKLVAARLNHFEVSVIASKVKDEGTKVPTPQPPPRMDMGQLYELMGQALGDAAHLSKWPSYGTIAPRWNNQEVTWLVHRGKFGFVERLTEQKCTSCLIARDCKRLMRQLLGRLALRTAFPQDAMEALEKQWIVYSNMMHWINRYYGENAMLFMYRTKSATAHYEEYFGLFDAPN